VSAPESHESLEESETVVVSDRERVETPLLPWQKGWSRRIRRALREHEQERDEPEETGGGGGGGGGGKNTEYGIRNTE